MTLISEPELPAYSFSGLYLTVCPSTQALRVSMEEQRQRQEEEARRVAVASAADVTTVYGKEREGRDRCLSNE